MGLRSGPRKTEQEHTMAVISSIIRKSREMDPNEALREKYLPE